ncbi:MAG: glycosyltransferase family 2 protein [Parcubacteria group bacterium]|jgi:cellulose synthase/poly-beta-1,6-N-acetylglucosamine synthase-like glycosyltransferase
MSIKITNSKKSNSGSPSRKRQWGTEHQTLPLSNLHKQPSSRSVAFSRFSIVLTIFFWAMYVISVVFRQLIDGPQNYRFTMEVFGYLIIVTFLTFSALIYLIARQGALQRFSKHIRTPRAIVDRHFSKNRSSITVLIPSYSEETQVIRKTMLSAALQEYPEMRVILLLDDNPFNVRPEDATRLKETLALGAEIKKLLSKPYKRFSTALSNFENTDNKNKNLNKEAIFEIATHYLWAEKWLNELAQKELIEDHVDSFFADQVLRGLAKDLSLVGKALATSYEEGAEFSVDHIAQLYRRLVWTFGADLDVFERKRYISLSHEPNKAMNLNSYIGLMGGMYIKEQLAGGTVLTPTKNSSKADMIVPNSEFILTLDADSILLREYCLRLVYFLQQPDNADVAVVQTPYSSFRGAPTRIERLSGATTDIQHIIHQGMSHYDATFWVGANAVIRKCALEDIVEKEWVGGFEIKRYVQDRTVIEDTESSIDLALKDWRLVNYPERLSYSATPPDFGSLVIQRRRWANGGLLIMPKLWTLLRKRKNMGKPISKLEFMVRLNYMASIAWSNFGLIFLLVYPYDGRLLSPLVLLAATPYFLSMAVDLKYCRYDYSDIIRIYGFNLILLPVNIAGTFKSFEQALTANKTPFARTPKVKNRTSVALPYVISPLFIVAFSLFTLWRNIEGQNWGNAAFAGFNAFASTWAIVSYIGIRNLIVDIWLGLTNLLFVEVSPNDKIEKTTEIKAGFNWQGVLYHGEASRKAPHGFVNETVIKEGK